MKELQNDSGLKRAKALADDGGLTSIKYQALDISKPKSITDFATLIQKEHPEGIDMVVNNAGIAMQGFGLLIQSSFYVNPAYLCADDDVVEQTLQCNYYGTLFATESLLPLIRQGGRLVNVSSMAGHLNTKYSTAIRSAFASTKSVGDVTSLMEDFSSTVKGGKQSEKGWPSAAYAVSKSGIIGMTRAIALKHKQSGGTVLVNSCCPGYVSTDMTKNRGRKTVDEGAQTPVLLALGNIGGTFGQFWQHERVIEW